MRKDAPTCGASFLIPDRRVDYSSKHRRLKLTPSPWTDRRRIYTAFDELFCRYEQSIIVVSYHSDGIPTADELVTLLRRYESQVRVVCAGTYQYVLSTNRRSNELLIIGE